MTELFFFVSFILVIYLLFGLNILTEYERGVVFTLGRFSKVIGPGLAFILPGIQEMRRMSLRTIVHDVPPQDVISKDNVSLRVDAVLYYRIENPQYAVIEVENVFEAISQLAQTTLRSVLGQNDLDELLAARDKLNHHVQRIIEEQATGWGIRVKSVEIKRVDLNESMIRAMAKQAEAERERRAKVINAEGELQASSALLEAAKTLAQNPQALQLRYLHTLNSIANEKSSVIVLPLPMELFPHFQIPKNTD